MAGVAHRQAKGGALPNLIVIGAHQCGTSALHYYLGLHPEIQMSSPKELRFFLAEDDFDPGPYGEARRPVWPPDTHAKGIDWYASHFSPGAHVRGESSPVYSELWHPGVAERMASVVPDARLIFLVRDPLERAVSDWMSRRSMGRERRDVEEGLSAPGNTAVGRSRYWSKLRPFLERFPRERLHLMRQEDFLHHRRRTISEAFAFLGVDARFWDRRMERLRNQTGTKDTARYRFAVKLQWNRFLAPLYRLGAEPRRWIEQGLRSTRSVERPRVSDELRRRILDELEPEITGMEELTGWDLEEWRA